MAKKRTGKKASSKKKGKVKKKKPAPEEPAGEKESGERPRWKRMGLAIGVAIGIDAAFLPVIFVGFVINVIIVLMLAPYLGAFVGARWLKRKPKVEWAGSAVWVTALWASILALLTFLFLTMLGRYDFQLEMYGSLILLMVYGFIFIFSLAGFYHGAEEEYEEEPCSLCGLPCDMCTCGKHEEE